MQEAKMFPILRYILLHNKNNSIQFPGKSTWLVARGTNNFSFSLYCWLCKNPLSLRLPQYLDLCAFYVHNLKSAKAGSRASEGGRKCAQISGCFPEDSLTYGLRFLEFDRTPNFWQEARLNTRKNSGSSHYLKVLKDCVVCKCAHKHTQYTYTYS